MFEEQGKRKGLNQFYWLGEARKEGLFLYVMESEEWILKAVAENLEVGKIKTENMKLDGEEIIIKEVVGEFIRDRKEVADERSWQ